MRYSAKGRWVAACWKSMLKSNSMAARVFAEFNCSACTDVTGFGLIGHLLEMIQFQEAAGSSSGKRARVEEDEDEGAVSVRHALCVEIRLNQVPLLPGARECIAAGVFSSLQPQNARCARAVDNVHLGEGHCLSTRSYKTYNCVVSVSRPSCVSSPLRSSNIRRTPRGGGLHSSRGMSRAIERKWT